MAVRVSRLERRQNPLNVFLRGWYRGKRTVVAGPQQTDIRGKTLNLNHPDLIRREGNKLVLGRPVLDLLDKIKTDARYRTTLEGHFTGYDIRTIEGNPALWVLVGLALAADIMETTGKKTGHIVHLGRDCYEKHEEVVSIVAETLLQTGICRNGGGLVNFGIVDGGTMKLTGGFARAKTKKHGHWFYATVSHVAEAEKRGGKVGVNGEVVTTEQLVSRLFNRIVEGKLAGLTANDDPKSYVRTVAPQSYLEQQIALGQQVIRARTSVSRAVPRERLLEGVQVAVTTDDSPLVKTNINILRALGVDVLVRETSWNIRDPDKGDSAALKELKALAQETGRPVMFWDPDHDRVGFVVLDESGIAVNVDGSELLLLAAHNLATYNPTGSKVKVVGDMRAFIPLDVLGQRLRAAGFNIEVIPSEPGYSNIQVAVAANNAAVGAERTSHFFTLPLTNRFWGAADDLPSTQGGDNAPLATCYFLGLQKHAWAGRSLLEQLAYIRATYNLSRAVNLETKPRLDDAHGLAKIYIAAEMRRITKESLSGLGENLEITEMRSGVRIYDRSAAAAVLIRHSNTGPTFTVSNERLADRPAEGEAILRLGAAITQLAVAAAKEKLSVSSDPKEQLLKDFVFDWEELAPYKSDNPNQVIAEYRAKFRPPV